MSSPDDKSKSDVPAGPIVKPPTDVATAAAIAAAIESKRAAAGAVTNANFDQTQVGSKDLSGQVITDIIAADANLLVYFIGEQRLCLQTPPGLPTTGHDHKVLKVYERLYTVINRTMPAGAESKSIKRDLGLAAFHALLNREEPNPEHYFDTVNEHLEARMRDYASIYYIVAGSIAGLLVFGLAGLGTIYYFAHSATATRFLMGAGFGALGAVISICTRASKLKLSPFTHRQFHAFQGFTRSQLGAVFGLIVVLCVSSGILLGPFQGSRSALAVLAVLAGYSERFVPELLSRIEKDSTA